MKRHDRAPVAHLLRSRTVRLAIALAAALVTMSSCTSSIPVQAPVTRSVPTLAACEPTTVAPTAPTTVTADRRTARLITAAGHDTSKPAPLLVSLHPFVLDAVTWESYAHLAQRATERGYVVLAPRGSAPGPRWSVPGGLDTGVDDIGWIEQLIESTARAVCIDPTHIVAAGYSAGNAMAVGLGCELPGRFAAIAGSGGSNLTSLCPDSAGVDALLLHGTADPIAPPTGNTIPFTPPVGLHIDDVVASFAQRNGCEGATTTEPFSRVTVFDYRCSDHRLSYWRMDGAGHTWAGTTNAFDGLLGPTNMSFSATDVVLDFFDAA